MGGTNLKSAGLVGGPRGGGRSWRRPDGSQRGGGSGAAAPGGHSPPTLQTSFQAAEPGKSPFDIHMWRGNALNRLKSPQLVLDGPSKNAALINLSRSHCWLHGAKYLE